MANVGNAVHGFLAADVAGLDSNTRKQIAEGLLVRWELTESLTVENLLQAGDALRAWVKQHWSDAVWHREWPVMQKLPSGSTLGGIADLVLEQPTGIVIIDHKTFPGSQEQAIEKAQGFAAQLAAYGQAVSEATGQAIAGMFIHLPVGGLVLRVETTERKGVRL